MAKTKVLITVTTYPLPSDKYQELVCTAGILEDRSWIRIYPIPLSYLIKNRFRKYNWIEIDLTKRDAKKDFRLESYNPVNADLRDLKILSEVKTKNNWEERKKYCLVKVYDNLGTLIEEAHDPNLRTSLATYRPKEILDFIIKEDERDWKPKWKKQMEQLSLFTGDDFNKFYIRKVPYKFSYRFRDGDDKIRTLMVEDWEIGQLYWNCIKSSSSEQEALEKVRNRCWNELVLKSDLHFFLGTTLQWHRRKGANPFLIVGLFYPRKETQMKLF